METSIKPWEIVSETLKTVAAAVRPGVSTLELDAIAEKKILELGGTPYNKGYKPDWAETPFPGTLCTSVNDTIVHGIPSDYILNDGDIICLDVGVKKDGLCGDAALTVPVGEFSSRDERLLRYAKNTLYVGIDEIKAGIKIKQISAAMEKYAKQMGFLPNLAFCGHSIGTEMHEEPLVPNYEIPGLGEDTLVAGQMICLEPMLSYKDNLGVIQEDGWTVKTKDGRKSAMFEHQILVKEDGYEILTTHITR